MRIIVLSEGSSYIIKNIKTDVISREGRSISVPAVGT